MTDEVLLAVVGAISTIGGTAGLWGPKLFEVLKSRHESHASVAEKGLDLAKATREDTAAFSLKWERSQERVIELTQEVARLRGEVIVLTDRLLESERSAAEQINKLSRDLSAAMRKIEHLKADRAALQQQNQALTRDLQKAKHRIEELLASHPKK